MKRIILLLSSAFLLCGFVSVDNDHGAQTVDAQFEVAASRDVAWQVLTDYDNLPKFISSLVESKVLDRKGNCVLVEQEALGKAFLFKKRLHTTLHIIEFSNYIEFYDVSGKDFIWYIGHWEIVQNGNSTIVKYHLQSKSKFSVPFSRHVMQKNIAKLLNEVEKEILRRQVNGK
jgi:ribosome-associated toxin RatA of RatAB toxin-antitoxin module